MKWRAYCKVCEKFLADAGPEQSAVLVSAQKHADDERHAADHSVAVGLCSYSGGRFVFTPLSEVRRSTRPPVFSGPLTYYDPDLMAIFWQGSVCLFNDEEDEEDEGNLWDNIVRTLEDVGAN